MNARKLLSAAKAVEPVFVEELFSTYLYTGNGSTQTITNGIDLSGKGGLTWIKSRNDTYDHYLYDTLRGATKSLQSDTTTAEQTYSDSLTAFNSNGFALGANVRVNANTTTYASWTFRKQAKFFDVVTYTGDGASGRAISHNLGSTPGCIIVKDTGQATNWPVYHRSRSTTQQTIFLNSAGAFSNANAFGNPTSTNIVVGGNPNYINENGQTYVAYLFAHDAGGFGASGSDNVITCGSFTTDSSGNATVTLGYEPQWVLFKRTNSADNWIIVDTMRGFAVTSPNNSLFPNLSNAENTGAFRLLPSATGFLTSNADGNIGGNNTYIYIAIRRGPMKTPTTGTSVFSPVARSGTGANATVTGIGFAPDAVISGTRTGGWGNSIFDKLRGVNNIIRTNLTSAENSAGVFTNQLTAFNNTGYLLGDDANYATINFASGTTYVNWVFQRAPGFFDVVCYTGTGANRTVTHNLGVAPELMIVKKRSATDAWIVYANNDNTDYLVLNTTAATVDDNTIWNDTSPTASVFTVGTNDDVNGNTATFVAYLFATCPGVSKVGSYTGTGSVLQIDCGFTGGARFVLIKRTDSTGDWYVWDSARGIVAGNDPYLLLNSTAAEVTTTDWVDTYSAGFELSNAGGNNANINTATYIFLAIA